MKSSAKSSVIFSGFLAALIMVLFWDLIIYRVHFIFNQIPRGGDILQHVAPTWRYYFAHQGIELPSDIISDYYLDVILPPLYKFIYWILTFFVTPPESSSILALGLNLIIISALSASAYVATRSALVTAVVTGVILNFMTLSGIWSTGLERSMGTALLSVALLCLVAGRFSYLFILSLVSVLIYPPAALLIFGSYCIALLMEKGATIEAFKKVMILGVLFGVAATPQILGGKKYGPRLSGNDAIRFEEVGAGGRLSSVDRGEIEVNPWKVLKQNVGRYLVKISLKIDDKPLAQSKNRSPGEKFKKYKSRLVTWISGLILLSFIVLILKFPKLDREEKRGLKIILVIPAAMMLCYVASILLFPWLYIPSRYISIGASVVMLCIVPILFWSCLGAFRFSRIRSVALFLLFGGLIFLLHGGLPKLPERLNDQKANSLRYQKRTALEEAVVSLSPQALLVGWPAGRINSIPFVTGRNALITEETHQVFHKNYLYEMRRRMEGVTELMCASSGAKFDTAALKLRNDFGASHILIDLRYQRTTPEYFAPFGKEVAACRTPNPRITDKFLINLGKQRIIYKDKQTALLEIVG